jgi:uncharacterized repeat protein (TIGR03803 family)
MTSIEQSRNRISTNVNLACITVLVLAGFCFSQSAASQSREVSTHQTNTRRNLIENVPNVNNIVFKTLISFDGTNGANPYYGPVVQGLDGNFYGTTELGGDHNDGTVFKITPEGVLTTLHSFDGKDGSSPYAGLVLATDGFFYGTTYEGGADNGCYKNCGTVFRITPEGALTTLHSFRDDENPNAGLVQATDGNFYGTTEEGGANGYGAIFKIDAHGALTTLYSFCAETLCNDGAYPEGGLIQATDGSFYGTTFEYGVKGGGTVFKITPEGTLTTLHSFSEAEGADPYGGVVQAADGNFYGTNSGGGRQSCTGGCGAVFKITPKGKLTVLHRFDGTDGSNPYDRLTQATDGNFYGTTNQGGANIYFGTIFEITTDGTLTTLHTFDGTHGEYSYAGLLQSTDGLFYGTTFGAGETDYGTIFSLSAGLEPFVEMVPTSGKVRAAVKILGTNLSGASSVKFNGKSAVFKVVSGSEITTTVPTGATTGKIEVTTPPGTLKSNVVFRVTK